MGVEINKDNVNVGDVVYVKERVQVGFDTYRRYTKLRPFTIERITPKRTKFITTNGYEFANTVPFYVPSDEDIEHNKVCFAVENIRRDVGHLRNVNLSRLMSLLSDKETLELELKLADVIEIVRQSGY